MTLPRGCPWRCLLLAHLQPLTSLSYPKGIAQRATDNLCMVSCAWTVPPYRTVSVPQGVTLPLPAAASTVQDFEQFCVRG